MVEEVIPAIIISVLPKDKSFTTNSGTKAAVLLKGRFFHCKLRN